MEHFKDVHVSKISKSPKRRDNSSNPEVQKLRTRLCFGSISEESVDTVPLQSFSKNFSKRPPYVQREAEDHEKVNQHIIILQNKS